MLSLSSDVGQCLWTETLFLAVDVNDHYIAADRDDFDCYDDGCDDWRFARECGYDSLDALEKHDPGNWILLSRPDDMTLGVVVEDTRTYMVVVPGGWTRFIVGEVYDDNLRVFSSRRITP